MSPLFETIRIEDGVPMHLGYHQARMDRSRRELFGMGAGGNAGGACGAIDLAAAIHVPGNLPAGIHRCRVEYGEQIDHITFTPYTPREVRSLALVEADDIVYDHKLTDRSAIEKLREGNAGDDILIVRRGMVTDSSYANVVFRDVNGWVTPAEPLLAGTARARLLDEGRIKTTTIRPRDLTRYSGAVLINAMLGFREERLIDIADIR